MGAWAVGLWETASHGATYNPMSRHVIQNPYRAYSECPDAFDITRKGPRHTSFGVGVHYCIGAELARMEAGAIFAEALRSTSAIRLDGEPLYRPSTVIRGLAALPLRIE